MLRKSLNGRSKTKIEKRKYRKRREKLGKLEYQYKSTFWLKGVVEGENRGNGMRKLLFLKFYYLFGERGEGREKEVEKHVCAGEILMGCLSHAPQLGTWPTTKACALTRNRTRDLLVYRATPNPLSHTSQGWENYY